MLSSQSLCEMSFWSARITSSLTWSAVVAIISKLRWHSNETSPVQCSLPLLRCKISNAWSIFAGLWDRLVPSSCKPLAFRRLAHSVLSFTIHSTRTILAPYCDTNVDCHYKTCFYIKWRHFYVTFAVKYSALEKRQILAKGQSTMHDTPTLNWASNTENITS